MSFQFETIYKNNLCKGTPLQIFSSKPIEATDDDNTNSKCIPVKCSKISADLFHKVDCLTKDPAIKSDDAISIISTLGTTSFAIVLDYVDPLCDNLDHSHLNYAKANQINTCLKEIDQSRRFMWNETSLQLDNILFTDEKCTENPKLIRSVVIGESPNADVLSLGKCTKFPGDPDLDTKYYSYNLYIDGKKFVGKTIIEGTTLTKTAEVTIPTIEANTPVNTPVKPTNESGLSGLDSNTSPSPTPGIIAGVSIGIIAFSLFLSIFIYKWQRSKKEISIIKEEDHTSASNPNLQPPSTSAFPTNPPKWIDQGVNPYTAIAMPRVPEESVVEKGDEVVVSNSTFSTGPPKRIDHGVKTYTAIGGYLPRLPDELVVVKGDEFVVQKVHEDGWAISVNLRTKNQGLVAMALLSPN